MKLDTAPGVTVSIRVDGETLNEYDGTDDTDDNLTVMKYVEALPGSNFTIFLNVYNPYLGGSGKDHLQFGIYLDGKHAFTNVLDVHNGKQIRFVKDFQGIYRMLNGQHVVEKFKFDQLQTHDEGAKDEKISSFKSLGDIEVRCTLVRPTPIPAPVHLNHGFRPVASKPISEKCLKGRAISNQVAKPEIVPGHLNFVRVESPYGIRPFATYKFKYRSRRDLQIEGIIPRTPSPAPLEERDPDTLSLEEARELLRRNRARDEEQAKIKQEGSRVKNEKRNHANLIEDDDEDDDDVTIAREPRKRSRTSRDSAIEIIDLSDD